MIFWAGVSSDDVRVKVEHYPALSRPARKIGVQPVPGRNGDLLFVEDAFENYIQPYDIYLSAEKEKATRVSAAAAQWLFGPKGYQRLEDVYEPDFYRLAYFAGPVEVENIMNRFGRATIEFNCKPQRFYKLGEFTQTSTDGFELLNPSPFPAMPLITVHGQGAGLLNVGGTVVALNEIDGEIILDCEVQHAYSGTLSMDGKISAPEFPKLGAGTTEVTWSGDITSVDIIPRWWTL